MRLEYIAHYHLILCGTGGTGSQLLPPLVQLLNTLDNVSLTLIDGDFVEEKNLRNQKYLKEDIGSSKAQVLYKRYSSLYPTLDIDYKSEYLMHNKTLLELFESIYDTHTSPTLIVLIGCVDNSPTRKLLTQAYLNYDKNILYIDSGNGTIQRMGQIAVAIKNNNAKICTPCIGEIYHEIMTDKETIEHATSCQEMIDEHPQNIATNLMAANCLMLILINLLTFQEVIPEILYFDANELTIHHHHFEDTALQNSVQ